MSKFANTLFSQTSKLWMHPPWAPPSGYFFVFSFFLSWNSLFIICIYCSNKHKINPQMENAVFFARCCILLYWESSFCRTIHPPFLSHDVLSKNESSLNIPKIQLYRRCYLYNSSNISRLYSVRIQDAIRRKKCIKATGIRTSWSFFFSPCGGLIPRYAPFPKSDLRLVPLVLRDWANPWDTFLTWS